jgi:hypothetical protein
MCWKRLTLGPKAAEHPQRSPPRARAKQAKGEYSGILSTAHSRHGGALRGLLPSLPGDRIMASSPPARALPFTPSIAICCINMKSSRALIDVSWEYDAEHPDGTSPRAFDAAQRIGRFGRIRQRDRPQRRQYSNLKILTQSTLHAGGVEVRDYLTEIIARCAQSGGQHHDAPEIRAWG